MTSYVVMWEMNIDADTPEEAAQAAWDAMRRPDSTANVFQVVDALGDSAAVDLQEIAENACPTCDGCGVVSPDNTGDFSEDCPNCGGVSA